MKLLKISQTALNSEEFECFAGVILSTGKWRVPLSRFNIYDHDSTNFRVLLFSDQD